MSLYNFSIEEGLSRKNTGIMTVTTYHKRHKKCNTEILNIPKYVNNHIKTEKDYELTNEYMKANIGIEVKLYCIIEFQNECSN